ncbi:MAG: hypothetical protein C7B46_12970 [Sulfobacillus benefaciens]|uniref:Uncharacterized protein n=1 Tax=Sulfobacillus benefaciens TaxID=453960 RepID=A0A2T2XDW7_9FIRM|nr:MAG: hypothetical protein C7B46_12970 [Sulfobacillus benefaciens]
MQIDTLVRLQEGQSTWQALNERATDQGVEDRCIWARIPAGIPMRIPATGTKLSIATTIPIMPPALAALLLLLVMVREFAYLDLASGQVQELSREKC